MSIFIKFIPFLIILASLLISVIPTSSYFLYYFFTSLTIICFYFYSNTFSVISTMLIGLLFDSVISYPFGMHAILFLLLKLSINFSEGRLLYTSFVISWISFIVNISLMFLLRYILALMFNFSISSSISFYSFIILVLFYPIFFRFYNILTIKLSYSYGNRKSYEQ